MTMRTGLIAGAAALIVALGIVAFAMSDRTPNTVTDADRPATTTSQPEETSPAAPAAPEGNTTAPAAPAEQVAPQTTPSAPVTEPQGGQVAPQAEPANPVTPAPDTNNNADETPAPEDDTTTPEEPATPANPGQQ
jgi:hypothetical protein